MKRALLKSIIAFSLLLWSANLPIFAFTASLANSQSNSTSFSQFDNHPSFYSDSSSSSADKSLALIETLFEEVVEKVSFEDQTFTNSNYLSMLSSLKSEEIEHETKANIAVKGYFPCFFTYKSLFIKFCIFRI